MRAKACTAVFVALFGLLQAVSHAQETVSAIVRDINSYQHIPNVNVYLKDRTIGTSTDHTGRFTLTVPGGVTGTVVFQHIAFEPLEVPLDTLRSMRYVYLQPRVIPLRGVEVVGEMIDQPEIHRDLPQTVHLVQARDFEIRGYVDAGDLLRTDHSVQIDEELSGKKTVAIRGGNPDEVVVMYNGVKLNNAYDNIFDLSLIDLEDIQRFEIIKGSNTALYGPDAFSGVINIVPKTRLDYVLRFQQRIGTYRSGNWGLHVNPERLLGSTDRLSTSYSYKRGAIKRNFVDVIEDEDTASLENEATHHMATIGYRFRDGKGDHSGRELTGMFIGTTLDYLNRRDDESVKNTNTIFSTNYAADLSDVQNYQVTVAFKNIREQQTIRTATGFLNRDINDRTLQFRAENTLTLGPLSWLAGYQFQYIALDFLDDRSSTRLQQVGLESGLLKRQHHGFLTIIRLENALQSDFLQSLNLHLSARHDLIQDRLENAVFRDGSSAGAGTLGNLGQNDWRETTVKFSISFTGLRNDLALQTYLNIGKNIKAPTLFQQISQADDPNNLRPRFGARPDLDIERNNSIELGATLSRQLHAQPVFYGWSLLALYFQNHYDNKIVTLANITSPVASYYSVPDARISGLEIKPGVYMYKKKVSLEFGLSKYWISDKQAFPFKSDLKRLLNLRIDHLGYSFQALWFKEGEQIAWLRQLDGTPVQVILPEFTNLDLHFSKTFTLSRFKLFFNISGRNLLNSDEVILEGIAIRDRRYYITLGTQI